MQQQKAENIEAGRPRVWVPGQGWVAIDPEWDRQEATPEQQDTQQQSSEPEQSRPDAHHSSSQGYDADSEADGSEPKTPAADRAQTGGVEPADPSELEAGMKEEEGGETTEGKPAQSAYATSSGYAIRDRESTVGQQRESEGEDSADRGAESRQEEVDAEQRVEDDSDQDVSRQQNVTLELSEGHPEGQRRFDSSQQQDLEYSYDDQQAEESRSRVKQRERVCHQGPASESSFQIFSCLGTAMSQASAFLLPGKKLQAEISQCTSCRCVREISGKMRSSSCPRFPASGK